jgi:hypothetical protein
MKIRCKGFRRASSRTESIGDIVPVQQITFTGDSNPLESESCGFFDERFDDCVECFRLFPVAEVAGLIDDVHFRFGIAVGDDFEERMAAFELGGRIVVAPD